MKTSSFLTRLSFSYTYALLQAAFANLRPQAQPARPAPLPSAHRA